MLLFPPCLVQLLLQHIFKKPGLRDLTADGATWWVRQEAGFCHHGRQRKVETCPFYRRSTRSPVPGRAPQNQWVHCRLHQERPTSQPTSCIPYGSWTTQRKDAALRKWSMRRNYITVTKKRSTCGLSYFLRWISKMTAYLLKIMNSLVLLVQKGTQGEKPLCCCSRFLNKQKTYTDVMYHSQKWNSPATLPNVTNGSSWKAHQEYKQSR